MTCINHPDIETDVFCVECQDPVCENCRVTLAGKNYCRTCLEEKLSVRPVSKPVPPLVAKSKFWAFVLSIIPGAGYMYLGLMKRGLQAMIIFFSSIFIASTLNFDTMVPLLLPVLLFYTIFDTQQLVRRISEGYHVEDVALVDLGQWSNWRNIVGYGLVILGVLSLLDNFLPYYFNYDIMHRVVPPLLIIGLGVYILYRSTHSKREDQV